MKIVKRGKNRVLFSIKISGHGKPLLYVILVIVVVFMMILMCTACANKTKASNLLLLQIQLRKEQIAEPTLERLERMKTMGMNVDDLNTQMIFIHLKSELTPSQAAELQTLGITVYLDSWIPPVGINSTGFILAAMPINKLDALVAKDYVVSLETAEQTYEPQLE